MSCLCLVITKPSMSSYCPYYYPRRTYKLDKGGHTDCNHHATGNTKVSHKVRYQEQGKRHANAHTETSSRDITYITGMHTRHLTLARYRVHVLYECCVVVA